MVLKLVISEEAEAKLKAKADAAGVDVQTYASQQLERMVGRPRLLSEISGSAAEAFASSGMTEEQLSDLLEAEKHAMRKQKREKRVG